MKSFVVVAALCAVAFSRAASAEEGMKHPAYVGSAEFEQLKSLVGTWTGMMPMGEQGQPMEVKVEYTLIAGGSAILERCNPGTPMEMVSVYHDRGGKLTMTHYCMLGNQPQMDLTKAGDGRFEFSLRKDSVSSAMEPHMHSGTFALHGDSLEQTWSMWVEGKEKSANTFKLTRAM